MSNFVFWQKWLFVVSGIFVFFGLALAFLGQTPVMDPVMNGLLRITPTFWATHEVTPAIHSFQQWSYAVMGSELAGWGVFVFFITHEAFARREKWAWQCLALAFGVWYIPDTVMSLYAGVFFHALGNTLLLMCIVLPLVFARSALMMQNAGKGIPGVLSDV